MHRRAAAWGAVALTLTLAACTAPHDDTSPRPTPSPTQSTLVAELHLPDAPATVLDVADPSARAIAASQTFYESAPVVVVAPADDLTAQVSGAAVAVSLGAPLLLDGGADPAATRSEVTRLGAVTVLTVGGAELAAGDPAGTEVPAAEDGIAALVGQLLGVDGGAALDVVAPPAPGGELASVAALERTEPTLPTASPAPSAGATPLAHADLPRTVLADPPPGGLLMTVGDPGDLAAVATARAAGQPVVVVPTGDPRARGVVPAVSAALTGTTSSHVVGLGAGFGTADVLASTTGSAATGVELAGGGQLVFDGRRLVALYGSPPFPGLGVLGEQDAAASVVRAQGLAAEYQALTPDTVVPTFEIIVTIASSEAGPDGNYSNELPADLIAPWVDAAAAAGMYVVIDLQPGRTDFLTQAQAYESLLRRPNVGLALDPEWRLAPDQVHLKQIGSVGVDEINATSAWLAQLTREAHLPQKLLVLHEFTQRMIVGRERLDMSHPELALMVHVDGQGSQPAKAGTWAALQAGAPAGLAWGWKNFVDEDVPMLSPTQTYQVAPQPQLVTYQ